MRWGDGVVGQELKALITRIVDKRIQELRPAPRWGTLVSLDETTGKAMVRFAGDSDAVPVSAKSTDLTPDSQVRVAGVPGARYLDSGITGDIIVNNPTAPDAETNDGGWVTIRVATTNPAGPSNEDELDFADVTLDGTTDDEIFSFLSTGGTSVTRTIRFLLGSGKYYIKDSIRAVDGVTAIYEAAVPTALGEETVEFIVRQGFVHQQPVFKTASNQTPVTLKGISVTHETQEGVRARLTDSNHLQVDRCYIGGVDRVFYPQAGGCTFRAWNSVLAGTNLLALIRSGEGFDSTGGTCQEFILNGCVVSNTHGGLLSLDGCTNFWIADNKMEGKGTTAAVRVAQWLPAGSPRPPTYRQIIRGNHIVTRPIVESDAPDPSPFLELNYIWGIEVSHNTGLFLNVDPGTDLHVPVDDGEFVSLENFSQFNVLSDNLFFQASGALLDSGDPEADGTMIPACIFLDDTSENNTIWNPQQCVHDDHGNNETSVGSGEGPSGDANSMDVAVFTQDGAVALGTSGPWPIDREVLVRFARCAFDTPPETGDTEIEVWANDTSQIGTITIPAGERVWEIPLDDGGAYTLDPNETLNVRYTLVQPGSEKLTVKIIMESTSGGVGSPGPTGPQGIQGIPGNDGSSSPTGWIAETGSWTPPGSVTNRTGIVTGLTSNATARMTVGWRVMYTQDGIVKYGIITALTATTATIFCSSFSAVMSTGAITDMFYSNVKCPLGFPMAPSFWTVVLFDITNPFYAVTAPLQSNSVTNIYHGDTLGGHTGVVPIGAWELTFEGYIYAIGNTANPGKATGCNIELSTSSTGLSQGRLRSRIGGSVNNDSGSPLRVEGPFHCERKDFAVTSPTNMYLVMWTYHDTMGTNGSMGIQTGKNLRAAAVCAYL